jgi:cytochrome c oxidase subunit 2
MFSNLSNLAQGVDTAFLVILSVILFFLVSLTTVLIIFIYKYNKKRHPVAAQFEGSTKLEVIWTAIPLVLVLGMFYFGWTGWKPLYSDPPDDALPIKTIGRMWNWRFEYENGRNIDTLYVPQGKPVVLDLVSMDVIHSFYIPAFRLKQDVIPGKELKAWFIANSPGEYDIFCAEYCGLQHSAMYTAVKVLPQDVFEKWYSDTTASIAGSGTAGAATITPAMAGARIYQTAGCIACHSIDGTTMTGPSFKGAFGHEVSVITAGKERTVMVDEAYIKKSILEPNADLVKGFNANLMQTYRGQLSDEDINSLIEYIRSLQ